MDLLLSNSQYTENWIATAQPARVPYRFQSWYKEYNIYDDSNCYNIVTLCMHFVISIK